jgi:hypothetical protein
MRITVAACVAWAVLGLGACTDGAQQPTADASVLAGGDAACDAACDAGARVGIAIDQGLIASADQPLLDFFPEYADLATPERRPRGRRGR